MHIVKSFISPGPWKHIARIARYAMIAHKNKNGIGKIFFFLCSFHKFLKTEISKPESIQFIIGFKTKGFQRICRKMLFLKVAEIFLQEWYRADDYRPSG